MKFISFLTNSNLKVKKLRSTKFVKQKLAKQSKVVYKKITKVVNNLNDTKDNYMKNTTFRYYVIMLKLYNILFFATTENNNSSTANFMFKS